jgi:hypothetical protein
MGTSLTPVLKPRTQPGARRINPVRDRLPAHATSRKTSKLITDNSSRPQAELLPTDLDLLADPTGSAPNQPGHRFPLPTASLRHAELTWT